MSSHTRLHAPRRWRWLLAGALVAICVAAVPPVVLTLWGPQVLGRTLSAVFHTSVTVQRVTGGWWSGPVLHQLAIAESPTPGAPVLVRITRLAVNRALVPLVLSSTPIAVTLDDVSLHVQRHADGQWNVAALLLARDTRMPSPSAPTMPALLAHRRIDVTVQRGRLHLGRDGPPYTFEAHAGSPALGAAPVQGQLVLGGAAGASLTVQGQVQNIVGPAARTGHVDVTMTRLDLALATALVPALSAVQLRGQVQDAQVRLALEGDQGLAVDATLDLRQVQVHDPAASTTATAIEHLEIRLQGQGQGAQWHCDTLSIVGPGVRVALSDRAWLHVDQTAWRGHAAFTLHVANMETVTTVLGTLLPAGLHLGGRFQLRGQVQGLVSRAADQPWTTRLAGLDAHVDGSLSRARWRQEEVRDMVTKLHLAKGVLSIEQVSAKIAEGDAALHGELSLQEATPHGALQWRLTNVPLHALLGTPGQRLVISQAHGRIARVDGGYELETEVRSPVVSLPLQAFDDHSFRLTHAVVHCTALLAAHFRHLTVHACSLETAEMHVSLHEGAVAFGAPSPLTAQVDVTLDTQGSWLTPLLSRYAVQGVELAGRIQVAFQGEVHVDDPLKTLRGKGTVRAAGGVFQQQAFTRLVVPFALTPGRVQITHGRVAVQDGALEVQGEVGVFADTARPSDRLHVQFQQVPVHVAQRLPTFRETGAATLHTSTALTGTVRLHGTPYSRFTGRIDLSSARTRRQVRQGARVLAQVDLPAFHLTATGGSHPDGWQATTIRLQGDGLALDISHAVARRTPTHDDLSGTVQLHITTEVVTALTLGLLPDGLAPSGTLDVSGSAALHGVWGGGVSLRHVRYTGELRLAHVGWQGTKLAALAARLTVAQGRLTVEAGEAQLLGGAVRLEPGTFIDLPGPAHDFQLHLAATQLNLAHDTGTRLSLTGLFIPLFLLEPDRRRPMQTSGMLDWDMRVSGTYDGRPGWSTSVNGAGQFRITHGAVETSTTVSSFALKALTLPANLIDQSVKALSGHRGKPLKALESLGKRSLVFGTLESPIQIQAGVIRLKDDFTITTPEITLVFNGHSTLEGEVDYHIHSDLLHRLFLGELFTLPDKLPVLGHLFRHINPFHHVTGHIELSATVQGNVLRRIASGQRAVRVHVYLIR